MDKLKRNPVFKYLASVKLAVPLMFVMTVTVAAGTIVESRYNTEMARLTVYHTKWFLALLVLLFVNIFCATVSRIPFRKHHTGFVITHIGLLTLLTGSMITNLWGIDGQLRVEEKSAAGEVVLSDLVFEVSDPQAGSREVYKIDRGLVAREARAFDNINAKLAGRLSLARYIPFAKALNVVKPADGGTLTAVGFRLKSAFFDVTQWLKSEGDSETQMGPAHIALVTHDGGPGASAEPRLAKTAPEAKGPVLEVVEKKSGNVIQKVALRELQKRGLKVGPVGVSLIKAYEQAVVGAKNKLAEAGGLGQNPALELNIEHAGKKLREIVYAKFPDFTLHPDGIFGYVFRYAIGQKPLASSLTKQASSDAEPLIPRDAIHARLAGGGSPAGGNRIEFHVFRDRPLEARVDLKKAGQLVSSQWLKKGEILQTPWMGIQIFLNDVVQNGVEVQEVEAAEQPLRSEMLPSGLQVKNATGDESAWLLEGDSRQVLAGEKSFDIYFGRETLRLPFKVYLEKFSKVDYPGTQTPMSFESVVRVSDSDGPRKISMNEPLDYMGYTLYQASYVMEPGMPVSSVFSVNWDPGRRVKYAGSLILVVGIVVFTLMRSRLVNKKPQGRAA